MHSRLVIATIVLGIISAGLAALVMSAVRSFNRFVVLGAVVLVGSLPSLAGAVAARFGFRTAQEEADPFVDGLLQLAVDAMGVPIRNYIALAALGAMLLALGLGLIWARDRRAAPSRLSAGK
ncbi:MAG: hypothetical protein HYS09_01255 [Chloroflexi bacterium]|nr:hypothetical protein [Chloroflexota bacterium]